MKITHCMRCMEENTEEKRVCPHCGFIEEENEPGPHQLPYRTVLHGTYMVGAAIGAGGFGITYIGWDLNLGIKVAIKEYYPEGLVTRHTESTLTVRSFSGEKTTYFKKGKDQFLNEARALGKFVEEDGIVSVKNFFTENNTVYIVMEYLEGISLKEYAKEKGGKLEPKELLTLMKPVIESLSRVHEQGLIHRDISPDNIIICKNGQVKLIDFGAARNSSPEGEKTLSVMLKKGYSPEEQYREHGKQGAWTDVYSMSATIYALLTGTKPDEPLDRMEKETLKPVADYGVKLTKRQGQVLIKGLEVKAEDRVQTMEELYRGLYCEGKDNEFALRRRNRYKKGLIAGAVAAVLAVGAIFYFNIPFGGGAISYTAEEGEVITPETIAAVLPDAAADVAFSMDGVSSKELAIGAAPEDGSDYLCQVSYRYQGRKYRRDMEIAVQSADADTVGAEGMTDGQSLSEDIGEPERDGTAAGGNAGSTAESGDTAGTDQEGAVGAGRAVSVEDLYAALLTYQQTQPELDTELSQLAVDCMEQFAELEPDFLVSAAWHQAFEDALDQVKENSETSYDYVIVLPLDGGDASDAESIYERLTAMEKDAGALAGAGAVGIGKKEIDGYDCWCMFIKFTER